MKHYFVLTIIFASISISLAAQTTSLPSIQSQLDAMFAGLDKTKVPTGFLWDKAANIVEPDGYDGSALSDSNLVNLQVFHDIIYSLNAASVGADTLDRTSILSTLESSSTSNSVAVGLLFQSYNFIVADALVDNLIVYSNGVVSDAYAGGSWRNPYGTGYLIACAPGTCEVELGSVSFTLSNIDSTPDISPGAIWFDCGDGYGYRSVSLGTPFNVTFTSPGIYELKFKVSYAGSEYVSHSAINVSATSILPMYNYVQDSVSAYYNGVRFKAMVSYNPGCTFMDPLIVSEGFDPWKMALKDASANRTHYYSGYTDIDFFLQFAPSNITNKDIVYVDWYDCGADIRANAEVFKAVIRWVNAHKPSNASSNKVLGQSMGGLIARYALCSMESSGERHRTTMFISHDVPYNGANISPGIMYGYWDMWSIMRWLLPIHNFFTINDWPEELLNIGEYTSVKQMLPLYLTRNYSYDNSEYAALQEDLSDMGFPKGDEGSPLENIAIINGGKTANGNISLYSTGDHLLDFQFYASTGIIPELLLALISYWSSDGGKGLFYIPGKTSIQWDYQLNPFLSNGCLVYKSTASIKKKWLWLLPTSWCIHDSEKYAPSTGPAFDSASGSKYIIYNSSENNPGWDIDTSSIWWGTFDTSLDIAQEIMFIPTASAFAMNSDYFRDFSSNPPMPGIETPFTSYIQSDTATRHIDFFYGIESWLGTVSSTISGPLIAFQGDTYSISGATNSTTWTATESNIIGSNGTIQDSTHFGLLGLKATVNGQNSVCTKNKEILLEFPG